MPGNGLGKVYLTNLAPSWFTQLVVIRESIQARPLLLTTAEILAILALWPQAAPSPTHPCQSYFLEHLQSQEPGNEIWNTHSFLGREPHPKVVGLSRYH